MKFHSDLDISNFASLPRQDIKQYNETIETLANSTLIISKEVLYYLSKSINEIGTSNTVIHNDLLPFNIIDTGTDKPLLTDFCSITISFPESDLGRLLGDINCKTEDSSDRYYPKKWFEELFKFYIDLRIKANPKINGKDVRRRVMFGMLWNYAGIVESNIKDNDLEKFDKWVNRNIIEMEKVVKLLL